MRVILGVVIRNDTGLVIVLLSQRISLPFTVIEVETLANGHGDGA